MDKCEMKTDNLASRWSSMFRSLWIPECPAVRVSFFTPWFEVEEAKQKQYKKDHSKGINQSISNPIARSHTVTFPEFSSAVPWPLSSGPLQICFQPLQDLLWQVLSRQFSPSLSFNLEFNFDTFRHSCLQVSACFMTFQYISCMTQLTPCIALYRCLRPSKRARSSQVCAHKWPWHQQNSVHSGLLALLATIVQYTVY